MTSPIDSSPWESDPLEYPLLESYVIDSRLHAILDNPTDIIVAEG
jgi:hypothetical protein